MKKLITAMFVMASLAAAAQQQNTLLDQSFWQNAPDVNAVKAEIAKGNSPTQGTSFSDPILMAINAQAPTPTIKFLLDQPGVDPNKSLHDGRTYVQWAASRGNDEVMEYLISKGAKIDIEDSHGTTPLTFAASNGQQNTKVYDVLVAHGANLKKDMNGDGANVLLLAIAADKDFKLTDYFVRKGLSLKSTDAAGNNAFSYAAKTGNIELLKALLKKGLPVNQNAILMAAQGGGGRRGGPGFGGAAAPAPGSALAIYEYLEGVGVKPTTVSKTGQNVLHYIVRKQNQGEVISHFLSLGVDVNQTDEEGNNVFITAATSRDTALISQLLPKIKNINQINVQGNSALTMAVRASSPDMVRFLISKGADAKVLDNKGNNLAYYLIEAYRPQNQGRGGQGGGQGGGRPSGQQDERQGGRGGAGSDEFEGKISALKSAGLNIAAPQQNGNTLYHLAVAKNDVALFKRLEPLGIDINAKNKEGMTALHKAALVAKNDTLLKYLVSIGAKKDIGTSFNETAYDLASQNDFLTKNNVSVNFLK